MYTKTAIFKVCIPISEISIFFTRCLCLTNSYPTNAILARRGVFSPSKMATTLEWGGVVGGGEAGEGIASIKHTISNTVPASLETLRLTT